ncbi:F-box/LRR-repeat protein At3g58900-like [Malus sylvestris]|uniref:F-box/LRR-repeat protein At3g58900-like n=1 Tax=Malus sylvestris TaxID=3752 RepID=UPI0021AD3EFB|nr:F-box/LRR-repeat protein At3g58900-like [Malus sylvestris]
MGCKRKLRASTSCEAEGISSESGVDRFSDLPDEVAHHILSLLNFRDLTRVGALSKRCRQFHLSVPVVDFGTVWWKDVKQVDLARLVTTFDRYLHLRGHNRMQRVRIGLRLSTSEEEENVSDDHSQVVLNWIRTAVRCNVEELDLFLEHSVTSTFSLPSSIFHSQSLRSLSVSMDIFESQVVEAPSLYFSSNLRYLSLSFVKIVDEGLFKWISCCCKWIFIFGILFNDGDVHLSISGEKLENIVMAWSGCFVPVDSSASLKIFAPNLKNLKWDGNLRNSQDLGKLKSLEKVEICLKPQKNEFGKVVEVLCCICSAKVLIIHAKIVKALYKEGFTPTLILDNICNLRIHCESLNNKLVPALVSLLRRMPKLNILCIKTRCENLIPRTASHFGNEYWERQNLAFIHQLEEVSIENSYGSNEIEFARYILEHAQNLKKMVIVHRDDDAPSKVAGMVSRSKIISTASVLIRQDPHQIYKFRCQSSMF